MFFKIKTGFGKNDFIQIDETEVAQAMRAQINGGVCVTKNGTVSGNVIQQILPDWNKVMGWNADYVPQGEDYNYIGSRQEKYNLFLENAKLAIDGKPPKKVDIFTPEVTALAEKLRIK